MLLLGFAGAQAITIAALPAITNLYTPETFGLYSYHLAILSFLGYISSLRLNLKLQLVKDNEIIKTACYAVSVFFSIVVFVICFFITKTLFLSLFYFLVVLFLGFFEINTDFSSSKGLYKKIAKLNIVRVIIVVAFQVLLSEVNHGLFMGFFLGLVISQLLTCSFPRKLEPLFSKALDFSFMVKNTLISLVSYCGSSFPLVLIFYFTSSSNVGLFALADKIGLSIIIIMNNVISRLIYNDLNGQLPPVHILIFWYKRIVIISAFIISVAFLVPNDFFSFIFSELWSSALDYFKALTPWVFVQILAIPYGCAYIKLGLEVRLIKMESLKNLIRILSISVLFMSDLSLYDTILISSTLTAICSILIFYRDYKKNEFIFH
ncbi:lipopolysaccharide biosynthesis protein [Aeromonas veronii]